MKPFNVEGFVLPLFNKLCSIRFIYNYFTSFRDLFVNKEVNKKLGFYDITYRSVHLMQNQLANFQIKNHKTFMNINIPCDSCFPLEFYRAKEIVDLGSKIYHQTKKNY